MTSLYRGSLCRGSTVHIPTPPHTTPHHLNHFEYLYPQFTLSINIAAFVSWRRGGGKDKPTQPFLLRYVFTMAGLVPMLSRLKTHHSIRLLYPTFGFLRGSIIISCCCMVKCKTDRNPSVEEWHLLNFPLLYKRSWKSRTTLEISSVLIRQFSGNKKNESFNYI